MPKKTGQQKKAVRDEMRVLSNEEEKNKEKK